MKKIIIILAAVSALFVGQGLASAQELQEVDSLVYKRADLMDAELVGRNILNEVNVKQDASVASAYASHVSKNAGRVISGYRVRIFFDNGQTARAGAASVQSRFEYRHPGVAVYMAYVNPYFKVTVGDFRSKSDAVRMLNSIKSEFPGAFVVKENINYPVIDEEHSYIVVDTVKVLRKVER